VDPFRPGRSIPLRRCGRGQSRQRLAVIPRHPFRRLLFQLLGVLLQRREVIERIRFVQFAGVDQTHEQIADSGAVQRLVKECVFAIQNRLFQSTFHDVVIDRRACLPEEERQLQPVIQ
jgi:hypothetical protein